MSIRARLLVLVIAVLAPAVLAAVWGVSRMHQEQRAVAEAELRQFSRTLAAVVAQELAQRETLLKTLAAAPTLQQGDLATFYEYAKSVAPDIERTIVLSDAQGRQLLNTRLPLNARLPSSDNLPKLRRQLGLPPDATLISNLYFAPVGKRFSFALQVPVQIKGQVAYYLAMGSFAGTLQKLLHDQRMREGWNAAIVDRGGLVIGRRLDPDKYVGQPVMGELRDRIKAGPEDFFQTVRLDGMRVFTAYSPIGESGWTLSVSMPAAVLEAGLTRALTATILVTLALFGLAFLVATLAGRSITRQVAADQARASEQILAANRDLEQRVQSAVAETRRAQEALLQHQKLEALGRLTGGIAHDFNNLLQTLSTTMEVGLRTAKEPAALAAMEAGKRAVQSAVKLTRQLMTFGRAQPPRLETLDLRDEALRLQDLIRRALRADISLRFDFAGELWPVTVDEVQLELALLNAALNSRDAMPSGGELTVGAANVTLAEGQQPGLPAGDYVRLAISDTGEGIPAHILPRVFEPFFTTKDVGKGSGLGLAQVYGFAAQAGGAATIQSAPGRGTTLSLWLPRALRAVRTSVDAAPAAGAITAKGCTVLFVEDDVLVQSVVAPALEASGFRVMGAQNVEEALRLFDARADEIDIVFSDVVMPGGRSGLDLARELRRRRPGLPVVLATGYAEMAPASERVLAKPYRMDELRATLLHALVTESC